MKIEEARRIMFAAAMMWAIAKMDYDDVKFEVPTYAEQRVEDAPTERPEEIELRLRTELLDASVLQYARALAKENGQ